MPNNITPTKRAAISLILMIAFLINLIYQKSHSKPNIITAQDFPSKVNIAFGEHGSEWQNEYGKIIKGNKTNFGLDFFDINPDNFKKTLTVIINTGKIKTEVSNVTSISATEDHDRKNGFIAINITAKINQEEFTSHDIAREYVMGLLNSFVKSGWKNYQYPSDPRLKGKAALEYYKSSAIERNISEAKLRAQGIPIDTDYKNPPLPPAPAGQQNPIIPNSLK